MPQNCPKSERNRHFPAKSEKSYNRNISDHIGLDHYTIGTQNRVCQWDVSEDICIKFVLRTDFGHTRVMGDAKLHFWKYEMAVEFGFSALSRSPMKIIA